VIKNLLESVRFSCVRMESYRLESSFERLIVGEGHLFTGGPIPDRWRYYSCYQLGDQAKWIQYNSDLSFDNLLRDTYSFVTVQSSFAVARRHMGCLNCLTFCEFYLYTQAGFTECNIK
jgi:hypothetical protein